MGRIRFSMSPVRNRLICSNQEGARPVKIHSTNNFRSWGTEAVQPAPFERTLMIQKWLKWLRFLVSGTRSRPTGGTRLLLCWLAAILVFRRPGPEISDARLLHSFRLLSTPRTLPDTRETCPTSMSIGVTCQNNGARW